LGAEGAEGEGVVAFGEALAGGVGDERAVVVGGGGGAEGAEEEELAEGGFDEVGAADDFGDAEVGVVDGAGELVAGDVVFAPDEEVAEIASGDSALGAEVGVGENELFVIGDAEAPVGGDAVGERRERCVGGRTEGFGVDGFVVEMRGAGGFGDIAAGAGAGENQAGGVEAGEGGTVEREALALGEDGAVPVEAEPAEVFLKSGDEFGAAAGGVEVVVAEEERAAGGAGALVGDPESARVTEVEVAGGGRGQPPTVVGGIRS
jgi:hypothetical protein